MSKEDRKDMWDELFDDFEDNGDDPVDMSDYSKPFRVIVTHDYRKDEEKITAGGDLAWQRGWCLGMYEFPDLTKKRPEGITENWIVHNPELGEDSEITIYNPLIFTDSGHFIWGIQSDWGEDIDTLDLTFPQEAAGRVEKAIKLTTGGFSLENLGKN